MGYKIPQDVLHGVPKYPRKSAPMQDAIFLGLEEDSAFLVTLVICARVKGFFKIGGDCK